MRALTSPRWRLGAAPEVMLVTVLAVLTVSSAQAQQCMVRDPALRGSYAGDCVRGWAQGHGRAEGRDLFEGAFLDGQAHGPGVYTFADGTRFEGLFVRGQVEGRSRFHYASGDVLEGEFRRNRLQGVGRLKRVDGQVLLVELRGGTLVPLPAPAVAAPVAVPAAGPTGAAPLPVAAGPAQGWEARLDFDDLFPSYILTTATRRPVAATRSVGGALGLAPVPPAALSRSVSANHGVAYHGDHWGQIGIRLRNERPGTRVTVVVTAEEIAEPTQEVFVLDQVGEHALYPRLRYRFDRLRQWTQPGPVNVTWSVWVDDQPRGSVTRSARLRAVNDVPFLMASQRGVENMTWVFAGFVTEDAPWVPELLREAMAPYPMGAVGYQGGAEVVDLQVKAVYDLLQKRRVKYSSITDTAGARERVASQHVRFPVDSLRGAEANCADGTVLMATLLKRMGIEPVIVTGPGHMLLGYVREPGKPASMSTLNFVETTVVYDEPFATAVAKGRKQVSDWLAKAADDPMLNFVRLNPLREQGVMPITR